MKIITEGLERWLSATALCSAKDHGLLSGSSQEPEAVPGSLCPLLAFVDIYMHVEYRQVTTLMDINEN